MGFALVSLGHLNKHMVSLRAGHDAQEPLEKARLSKPLIGDDGRVYICLKRDLFAFESNGSIAWTLPLNYTCNADIAPVHGGSRKVYLVAENRVLKINTLKIGTSESPGEVFVGPEPGAEGLGEIIGLSVSISSSCVLINVQIGDSLHTGYMGNCFGVLVLCLINLATVRVVGETSRTVILRQSLRTKCLVISKSSFQVDPGLSSLDKIFTITPGNNGRLYITIPARALVLALDVSRGTVLWQRRIGPLPTADCTPVVDSNGWVSIGSLDGFIYSFSPIGDLKKFPKAATVESVFQVSPLLDCSGYAVYISQTEMEGKISRTIGEYTYVSAMKPKNIVFTMLVPATGSIYWSESYPGPLSSLLSKSDLRHFVLDERILLAFVTALNVGNPLPCRTTRQKLASSCSQATPKRVGIYTGNERAIMLFLLLESAVLLVLASLVRFCFVFWRKRKLQDQDLGKFLEKRRSLRLQKKAYDRTITELEQKAAEEAVGNDVLEKLGDMVREREGIERKLSTTYSLGRDKACSQSKSLLPLYSGKTRSYSFQGAKKESVTIFHTLSDTSSEDGSSETDAEKESFDDKESAVKAKAKVPTEIESSSDNDAYGTDYQ
ncbi:hypothetical protein RJ639_024422, partial [Escallonia herrerae]